MDKPAVKRDYSDFEEWRTDFDQGLPILMYHKVMSAPLRTKKYRFLYMPPGLFERQIKELRAASYRGVPLDEALDIHPEPARKVVFTFDDAFRSVFDHALEPLTAASFQAITYVVSDRIGKCNDWDRHVGDVLQPLMGITELKAWISAGQGLGAHTQTHPNLTRLPLAEAREEIVASKKKLEDFFGLPVNHFCYPYGAYNEPIRAAVEDAGFKTACTTSPGINRLPANPFELKRLTARYASRSLKKYWNRILKSVRQAAGGGSKAIG